MNLSAELCVEYETGYGGPMNGFDKFWCTINVETGNFGTDFRNNGAAFFGVETDEFHTTFTWISLVSIVVLVIAGFIVHAKWPDIERYFEQRRDDREYARRAAERARQREAKAQAAAKSTLRQTVAKPRIQMVTLEGQGGVTLRVTPSEPEDSQPTKEVIPMPDTQDTPEIVVLRKEASARFRALLIVHDQPVEQTTEEHVRQIDEVLDENGRFKALLETYTEKDLDNMKQLRDVLALRVYNNSEDA